MKKLYFLQTCDTCRRILKEINLEGFTASINIGEPQEKQLALKLLQFNDVVEQVAAECFPHTLCNYLYELSSFFMSFYEHCPILKTDVPPETAKSRLQLSANSAAILKQGLDLLGIEVMEKM